MPHVGTRCPAPLTLRLNEILNRYAAELHPFFLACRFDSELQVSFQQEAHESCHSVEHNCFT